MRLAAALTLLAATARADWPDRPASGADPRSKAVGYALAIGGTLAPLYAGDKLPRDRHAGAAVMGAAAHADHRSLPAERSQGHA
jgi:hypothetical protein